MEFVKMDKFIATEEEFEKSFLKIKHFTFLRKLTWTAEFLVVCGFCALFLSAY